MTTSHERRAMRKAAERGEPYDPARVKPARSGRRTREQRAIAAVACPECTAPIGTPCGIHDGRPRICRERKVAWQMVRDGEA